MAASTPNIHLNPLLQAWVARASIAHAMRTPCLQICAEMRIVVPQVTHTWLHLLCGTIASGGSGRMISTLVAHDLCACWSVVVPRW